MMSGPLYNMSPSRATTIACHLLEGNKVRGYERTLMEKVLRDKGNLTSDSSALQLLLQFDSITP